MPEHPFPPYEEPTPPVRVSRSKDGWRWTVGGILVLIALVPALVLLVFYYREVAVTYYMTRNPLQPSSLRMARTIETVIVGNMRDLSAAAGTLQWNGTNEPTSDQIRKEIGGSIQEGELSNFAGLAVLDTHGKVIARMDRRDIDPYLDQAKKLAQDLFLTGGSIRFRPIVVPGKQGDVFLMMAVRTMTGGSGSGGVLAGLVNLSRLLKPAMPIPRIHGTPGRSYLLSGDGLILTSSDPAMVGKNFILQGRKNVIDYFNTGRAGSFSKPIDGISYLYGTTLLGELTGIAPAPWIAVLEAPKAAIDREVARTRLNMNLIVFLLVPAFMIVIIFILYKSLRAT